MDNQLLISWTFFVAIALGLDIAAYIFLRRDWKKNGITVVDRFWNALFGKIDQLAAAVRKQVAVELLKYHRSTVPAVAQTDAASTPLTKAPPTAPPVELVPVTVRTVGNVRRVKFTLDMPLDTQVEVRIGATRESGVTVEKREL